MDVVHVVDDWAFLLFWRSRGAEPDRNGVSVQFVTSSTFIIIQWVRPACQIPTIGGLKIFSSMWKKGIIKVKIMFKDMNGLTSLTNAATPVTVYNPALNTKLLVKT